MNWWWQEPWAHSSTADQEPWWLIFAIVGVPLVGLFATIWFMSKAG